MSQSVPIQSIYSSNFETVLNKVMIELRHSNKRHQQPIKPVLPQHNKDDPHNNHTHSPFKHFPPPQPQQTAHSIKNNPPRIILPNKTISEFYEKPYATCKMCMNSKFKCKNCLEQLVRKLKIVDLNTISKGTSRIEDRIGAYRQRQGYEQPAINNFYQTKTNKYTATARNSLCGSTSHQSPCVKQVPEEQCSIQRSNDCQFQNYVKQAQKADRKSEEPRRQNHDQKESSQKRTIQSLSRQTDRARHTLIQIPTGTDYSSVPKQIIRVIPDPTTKRYKSVFNINKIDDDGRYPDFTSAEKQTRSAFNTLYNGESLGATRRQGLKLNIRTFQAPIQQKVKKQTHLASSRIPSNWATSNRPKQMVIYIRKPFQKTDEEAQQQPNSNQQNSMLPVIRQLTIQDKVKYQKPHYKVILKKGTGAKPEDNVNKLDWDLGVNAWDTDKNHYYDLPSNNQ